MIASCSAVRDEKLSMRTTTASLKLCANTFLPSVTLRIFHGEIIFLVYIKACRMFHQWCLSYDFANGMLQKVLRPEKT